MPLIETIETGYLLENGMPLKMTVTLFEVLCRDCGAEFLSLVKDENSLEGRQRCGECNDRWALGEFWEPYTDTK